jgi:hypothetical protein
VREIDDRRATIAAMAAVLLLLFTLTATPWTPFFWLGASLVITLLSLRHRRRVVGENRGRSSLCTTRHS